MASAKGRSAERKAIANGAKVGNGNGVGCVRHNQAFRAIMFSRHISMQRVYDKQTLFIPAPSDNEPFARRAVAAAASVDANYFVTFRK